MDLSKLTPAEARAILHKIAYPEYREMPVPVEEFFTSPQFFGEALFPRQLQAAKAIEDVLECKADFNEFVLLWGKGSGKDYWTARVLVYILYRLLCLNNPQEFLDFGKGENIDIINVAVNSQHANAVFFNKLKAALEICSQKDDGTGWFVKVERKPRHPKEYQVLEGQQPRIKFYHNITCYSGHADMEKFDGFSPFFVVFDEISDFQEEKAESVYKILRSSGNSRFSHSKWGALRVFISYPRYDGDFMIKKHEASQSNPRIYCDRGATWEINLNKKPDDPDILEEYADDPITAQCYYETIPPKTKDGFITYPGKIEDCMRGTNRIEYLETITERVKNDEIKQYVSLVVTDINLYPDKTYYFHGDPGLVNDSFMLVIGHGEPEGDSVRPVIDAVLKWNPTPTQPVDYVNVGETIVQISKKVYLKKGRFDKFNSAEGIQRLLDAGIDAEDMSFSLSQQMKMYIGLRKLIHSIGIELPRDKELKEELENLQLVNKTKVDHPKKFPSGRKGSKDIADGVASVAELIMEEEVQGIKLSVGSVSSGDSLDEQMIEKYLGGGDYY